MEFYAQIRMAPRWYNRIQTTVMDLVDRDCCPSGRKLWEGKHENR